MRPVAIATKIKLTMMTEAMSLRPIYFDIGGLSGSFFNMTTIALNKLNTMNSTNPAMSILINNILPTPSLNVELR